VPARTASSSQMPQSQAGCGWLGPKRQSCAAENNAAQSQIMPRNSPSEASSARPAATLRIATIAAS